MEKGVFEDKICVSLILEKKKQGSFLDRKFVKIRKRGSHLSYTITIFGQLGEIHLKVLFSLIKKCFDRIINLQKKHQ